MATSTSRSPMTRMNKVTFVSPLLDYGYPPAAFDLERQQQQNRLLHWRYRSSSSSNNDDDEAVETTTISSDPPLDDDMQEQKPLLLYLPGFDGTYVCPFIQFPELQTEFELWCMTVAMDDRSTYQELKAMVLDFIRNELLVVEKDNDDVTIVEENSENALVKTTNETANKKNEEKSTEATNKRKPFGGIFASWFHSDSSSSSSEKKKDKKNGKGRPIYIAGESFGGILASDVTLTILQDNKNQQRNKSSNNYFVNLQGLVLVNPATCYDRSQLAIKGPQVAQMPKALYVPTLFSQLLPLFTDEYSVEQLGLILQAKALPSVIDNPQRESYMGRVAFSLPYKLEFMPASTLSWRLEEWLTVGCATMAGSSFQSFPLFRTLIVVGEKDKTLPSIAEAERLANKVTLPKQTQIHVVEGAGHSSTCGSRLDLTAIMRNRFMELQKKPSNPRKQKKTAMNKMKIDSNAIESVNKKRTRMKPQAQAGTGAYFGMEERYDGAPIGLNPILYWSRDNYCPVLRTTQEKRILLPGTLLSCSYNKARYQVPERRS